MIHSNQLVSDQNAHLIILPEKFKEILERQTRRFISTRCLDVHQPLPRSQIFIYESKEACQEYGMEAVLVCAPRFWPDGALAGWVVMRGACDETYFDFQHDVEVTQEELERYLR